MYELLTDELRVEVLDPVADAALTGPRYCTGGYVFQVHDARHGPLMSGPTYPDDFNWFDGQGIPDSFALEPLRARGVEDGDALLLGVGVCDLEAGTVVERCVWDVAQAPTSLTFRTAHAWGGFACTLERTLTLVGRTLRSVTELINADDGRALPVRWFPHPFFPQPAADELFRTSAAVTLPESEGYRVAEDGSVHRRVLAPGHVGHYQELDHAASGPLTLVHRHDAVGSITMTTSYVPERFVVWGNHYTVSAEPFHVATLAPGAQARWTVTYTF